MTNVGLQLWLVFLFRSVTGLDSSAGDVDLKVLQSETGTPGREVRLRDDEGGGKVM